MRFGACCVSVETFEICLLSKLHVLWKARRCKPSNFKCLCCKDSAFAGAVKAFKIAGFASHCLPQKHEDTGAQQTCQMMPSICEFWPTCNQNLPGIVCFAFSLKCPTSHISDKQTWQLTVKCHAGVKSLFLLIECAQDAHRHTQN